MLKKRKKIETLYGDYIVHAKRVHITHRRPHICNDCIYINKTAQCQADDCGQIESYYCFCQIGEYKYQPYDVKEV